ncbi:hypothetical protein FOMPIDRAFT_1021884 [Fomitopsis schrenkii]|uniref:Uncharacterized protein n=1 Tax=Fomitopsis schrenkii TaxID=2126942 RepID=S8EKN6_FOMSC|nr:hypothetical protein FOMPIDRAFT_1021884 [Fomitopsis schrenkii]
MESPPPPPSPRHIQWRSRSSPTCNASSSEASSAIETPATTTSQGNGRPARHCDWIDCRYCPMLAQSELSGVAGASNWQSTFTTGSAKNRTSQRESRKATTQRTKTQTPGRGKKNSRVTRTNLTGKRAGGAPGAADQGPANGGRDMDAEEEYWEVASLLGLVRRA